MQEDDRHVKMEGGGGKEKEEVGGVESVSCIAMTWKNSLSSTMDRMDHLKGVLVAIISEVFGPPDQPICDVWHMVYKPVVDLTAPAVILITWWVCTERCFLGPLYPPLRISA
jgi:hypothetical protein